MTMSLKKKGGGGRLYSQEGKEVSSQPSKNLLIIFQLQGNLHYHLHAE